MADISGILLFLILYLPAGYVLYRMRWPKGVIPHEADPERERLLRTSRRRVLPLPPRTPEQ